MTTGHRLAANPSTLPGTAHVGTTRVVTLVDIEVSGCASSSLVTTAGTSVMATYRPFGDTENPPALLRPSAPS